MQTRAFTVMASDALRARSCCCSPWDRKPEYAARPCGLSRVHSGQSQWPSRCQRKGPDGCVASARPERISLPIQRAHGWPHAATAPVDHMASRLGSCSPSGPNTSHRASTLPTSRQAHGMFPPGAAQQAGHSHAHPTTQTPARAAAKLRARAREHNHTSRATEVQWSTKPHGRILTTSGGHHIRWAEPLEEARSKQAASRQSAQSRARCSQPHVVRACVPTTAGTLPTDGGRRARAPTRARQGCRLGVGRHRRRRHQLPHE